MKSQSSLPLETLEKFDYLDWQLTERTSTQVNASDLATTWVVQGIHAVEQPGAGALHALNLVSFDHCQSVTHHALAQSSFRHNALETGRSN